MALSLAFLASMLLAVGGGLGDAWLCAMSGTRSAPCPCTATDAQETPLQAERPSCCSRSETTAHASATPTRPEGGSALDAAPRQYGSRAAQVPSGSTMPWPVRGPPYHGPPTYLVHQSLLL